VSKTETMAKVSARGVFNISWGLAAYSIISAVGVMLVAGILEEAEYGLVAIALMGPNLIGTFRDWGVDWATIKYAAQYRSENETEKVRNVLAAVVVFEIVFGFLLSILSFILSSFMAANIFNRPDIVPLIQIASFTIFAEGLFKAAQASFTGCERMEYHSIMSIIYSIIKAGFMLVLVILGLGAFGATVGATVGYLVSGAISIALLYYTIYRKLGNTGEGKLELFGTVKILFRYGVPLSISAIISGFLAQFYNVLIGIYCSDQAIGNYQVALNFGFIVSFFVMPVMTVLLPAFSKFDSAKEQETLGNVFQLSVKYASLLIVPVTFAVIALAEPGVAVIFGEKYAFSPLFLALYVVTFIYTAFGYMSVENIIKSQGNTDVNMKLTLITSAIALVMNLLLIPPFGILGLLITNAVSGIPSLIISLRWIKKNYGATIDYRSSMKILVASAAPAALTYFVVVQIDLYSWLALILGAGIFFAGYLVMAPLMGAINKKDVGNFRAMLQGLGPLARLFTLPLSVIERLTPN